jgi:hypothetical protein
MVAQSVAIKEKNDCLQEMRINILQNDGSSNGLGGTEERGDDET